MHRLFLKSIKWKWILETGGAWFATYENNKIISMSGVHPFKDGFRALFRGAQLKTRSSGINKHHMQSYCFHSQLPYQIEFAGDNPVYITTNVANDASGKMLRINKTFFLLEKQNLVEHVSCEEIFYTTQNVWKLNIKNYNQIRKLY